MKLSFAEINRVDADKKLSANAKQTWHMLRRLTAGRIEWLKRSHAYLADLLSVSVSSIKRYLAELGKAGYLETRHNAMLAGGFKFKIANSYRLVKPGEAPGARKRPSLYDIRHAMRKAAERISLSLKYGRCEGEPIYKTSPSLGNPSQSAYEIMMQDRRDRLLRGVR